MQFLEQVPDNVKLGIVAATPTLTFLGLTLESWTYILSITFTLMLIIDKIPVVYKRLKAGYAKIKQMVTGRN